MLLICELVESLALTEQLSHSVEPIVTYNTAIVLDINLKIIYIYPFCGVFHLLQLVHIAHLSYKKKYFRNSKLLIPRWL